LECVVEQNVRRCQIKLSNEAEGFRCTLISVHAVVFPFNREGTLVSNVIQRTEDSLEWNAAPARGYEIPSTPVVTKSEV
jgi:hypothetical protein